MPKSVDGDKLDAVRLKDTLWETLHQIKSGKITAGSGDAIAAQAREILRTVKTQLAIFGQSGTAVTQELVDFAKPRK